MNPSCFALLTGLWFFTSCQKKEESLSGCMQTKMTTFNSNSCDHGAKVDQYIFQGQTVLVFILGFCGADLPAEVVDKNCNRVGTLGGPGGNTRVNGEEFSNATYVGTIWSR